MEGFDAQLARRVWDRVAGSREQLPVRTLISRERELATAARGLARQLQGKPGQLLEGIGKRAEQHILWLKGMCLCDGEPIPGGASAPVGAQPAAAAVRRLYSRNLALLEEYRHRQEDGQYGPVYGRMAREKADSCAVLLELMAMLGEK